MLATSFVLDTAGTGCGVALKNKFESDVDVRGLISNTQTFPKWISSRRFRYPSLPLMTSDGSWLLEVVKVDGRLQYILSVT